MELLEKRKLQQQEPTIADKLMKDLKVQDFGQREVSTPEKI